MAVAVPRILHTAIVSDDVLVAAALSCAFAQRGAYLPVLEGPRMAMGDGPAEAMRRRNALARAKGRQIFLAALDDDARAGLEAVLPANRRRVVADLADARTFIPADRLRRPPLAWGPDRLGVGLLHALRAGTTLEIGEAPSPPGGVPSRSGHIVVCEAEEAMAQIIAANYAFALGAGLEIVPAVADHEAEDLFELLYGVLDAEEGPAARLAFRIERLRGWSGGIVIPKGGSATFVSRRLPFGLAFPEAPSTHLFAFPDLGLTVINGFAAEQSGKPGVNLAMLVDPGTTPAPEIKAVGHSLAERGVLIRHVRGTSANVRDVSELVSNFPYDLLVFATHCGDAPGYRWTYEYTDTEGIDRRLVVDIALGVGREDEHGMVSVLKFMRFHELDGISWTDPVKKADLYVGRAILDWRDRESRDEIEPVEKISIPRVVGSAAMQMYDNNYVPVPDQIADRETPIIVNNACTSWRQLASRFIFSGARAYVGTLVPVIPAEASDIAVRLLGKHYGKALPHALWCAQNEVYGDGPRRPYVVTGVYPQKLRVSPGDIWGRTRAKLEDAAKQWRKRVAELEAGRPEGLASANRTLSFYERELTQMQAMTPRIDRIRRPRG
jgi:hypothetical protein